MWLPAFEQMSGIPPLVQVEGRLKRGPATGSAMKLSGPKEGQGLDHGGGCPGCRSVQTTGYGRGFETEEACERERGRRMKGTTAWCK